MIIRSLQGRSPFHADKSHFSHRLVELGLRTKGAVLTVHLATLTTGLAALLLYRVHDWPGAILILALVVCILAIIAILETAGHKATAEDRADARASDAPYARDERADRSGS